MEKRAKDASNKVELDVSKVLLLKQRYDVSWDDAVAIYKCIMDWLKDLDDEDRKEILRKLDVSKVLLLKLHYDVSWDDAVAIYKCIMDWLKDLDDEDIKEIVRRYDLEDESEEEPESE